MHEDERRKQITANYMAGLPVRIIAKNAGVTDRTIRKLIAKYGLPERNTPATERSLLPDQIEFLAAHYKQPGWTAERIGQHLGKTKNAIIGLARRLGIAAAKPPSNDIYGIPKAPPLSKCQWINGDVTPAGDFHYCGNPVAAGSYCHDHAVKAYPLYRKNCELTMEEAS